jgi:hypothetical protein
LLSFLPCLPLAVRTVLRFLGVPEITCPETTCARQSQEAEHQQDCETTNVICFHDCLLVGERS